MSEGGLLNEGYIQPRAFKLFSYLFRLIEWSSATAVPPIYVPLLATHRRGWLMK